MSQPQYRDAGFACLPRHERLENDDGISSHINHTPTSQSVPRSRAVACGTFTADNWTPGETEKTITSVLHQPVSTDNNTILNDISSYISFQGACNKAESVSEPMSHGQNSIVSDCADEVTSSNSLQTNDHVVRLDSNSAHKDHSFQSPKTLAMQYVNEELLTPESAFVQYQSRNEDQACQVCGQPSVGFHHRAYVCEACKKFFMRHATNWMRRASENANGLASSSDSDMASICPMGGQCKVEGPGRGKCPHCRYRKCLTLGMSLTPPGGESGCDISQIPCRVCGGPSSGFHFGALTCEGCKGFFRRTVMSNVKLECLGNNACPITPANRNMCKSCRFQRCVVIGMSKKGSRIGRQPNAIKYYCAREISQLAINQRTNGQSQTQSGHQISELTSPVSGSSNQGSEEAANSRCSAVSSSTPSTPVTPTNRPKSRQPGPKSRVSTKGAVTPLRDSSREQPAARDPRPRLMLAVDDEDPPGDANWPSVQAAVGIDLGINSQQEGGCPKRRRASSPSPTKPAADEEYFTSSVSYLLPTGTPSTTMVSTSPDAVTGHDLPARYNAPLLSGAISSRLLCSASLLCVDGCRSEPQSATLVDSTSSSVTSVAPCHFMNQSSNVIPRGHQGPSLLLPQHQSLLLTRTLSPDRHVVSPAVSPQPLLRQQASQPQQPPPLTGSEGVSIVSVEELRVSAMANAVMAAQASFNATGTMVPPTELCLHGPELVRPAARIPERVHTVSGSAGLPPRSRDRDCNGRSKPPASHESHCGILTRRIPHLSLSRFQPTIMITSEDFTDGIGTAATYLHTERIRVSRYLHQKMSHLSIDNPVEVVWLTMMNHFEVHSRFIVNFSKRIPGFNSLELEDKRQLVRNAMYPLMLLELSRDFEEGGPSEYNYFDFSSEERSIILQHFPSFQIIAGHLVESGTIIHDLRLDDIEMTLICVQEIFKNQKCLKDPSSCQQLLLLTMQCLVNHIQSRSASEERNMRLTSLAPLSPLLERLNEEHHAVISQLRIDKPHLCFPELYTEMFRLIDDDTDSPGSSSDCTPGHEKVLTSTVDLKLPTSSLSRPSVPPEVFWLYAPDRTAVNETDKQ